MTFYGHDVSDVAHYYGTHEALKLLYVREKLFDSRDKCFDFPVNFNANNDLKTFYIFKAQLG